MEQPFKAQVEQKLVVLHPHNFQDPIMPPGRWGATSSKQLLST